MADGTQAGEVDELLARLKADQVRLEERVRRLELAMEHKQQAILLLSAAVERAVERLERRPPGASEP